ncbi:MAG TPA: glycosyltransferase family 2 protein [Chroococcidiopsis sp.]
MSKTIEPAVLLNWAESSAADGAEAFPTVAVVVPVFNEAANVEDCLIAILNSAIALKDRLQVWLVDDQSTDQTWAIAQALQTRLKDPRLHLLRGQPRPPGERWAGKNWACTQAAEHASGDYLLFVDADVRLQPGAIDSAVALSATQQVDLLTCAPTIVCGCLAEWLVQPLIFSTILIGFDFDGVNDPQSDKAFAAGPFMLFRRSAYDALGGHRAVAPEVVEDVELARRVKAQGLTLKFVSGSPLVEVRMYRSWAALWEGWTKNMYMGSQRSLYMMFYLGGMTLALCTLPWLIGLGLLAKLVVAGVASMTLWQWGAIALCACSIACHYILRRIWAHNFNLPSRYWWLTGVGGVLIAAIAIASTIKTETGWGWTWRGRQLSYKP